MVDLSDLQKAVDENNEIEGLLKQYLKENLDRLQYSVSFEAVNIEAPRGVDRPVIEASFMSHEDSISRNTLVRVFGSDKKEFDEVEIMVDENLWDEMRARWARQQPENEQMEQSLRDFLNLD